MMHRLTLIAIAVCCAAGLPACGGGGMAPPGPSPDFTIQASPGTVTATPGSNSTATTISVSGLNRFSGNVIVSITGLPPGATTAPVLPFAVAAGSSQPFTVFVPSTVAPGNIALTITGTSGLLSHSAALVLSVQPTPSADFLLEAAPGAVTAVTGGSSQAVEISLRAIDGFSETITLKLEGLPPGASTTPALPLAVRPGERVLLTIHLAAGTEARSFGLGLFAESGALVHSKALVLHAGKP